MVEVDGKYVKQPVISSLVLTPHRDLAYQFYYWIESMYAATLYTGDMSAIAQVLLRAAGLGVAGIERAGVLPERRGSASRPRRRPTRRRPPR